MQDARLRLFCIFALSVAAFQSVQGAALVFLWWAAFSRRGASLPPRNAGAVVLLTLGITAAATEVTAGGGLAYFFRLAAVFLIAFWAYRERVPGELLGAGASLFGKKWGFDIGLAGEMGMEALASLEGDITRMRMALQLKGKGRGIGAVVPLGLGLLHAQMQRSTDRASLLAVRGYTGGGSVCPVFTRTRADKCAAALAGIIVILSYVPLGDVFI